MNRSTRRPVVGLVALAAIAWLVGVGAALAQVEQAHLRIDGMT